MDSGNGPGEVFVISDRYDGTEPELAVIRDWLGETEVTWDWINDHREWYIWKGCIDLNGAIVHYFELVE